MLYANFESSYTRIDPDGTTHIWENKISLLGSGKEVCEVIETINRTPLLDSIFLSGYQKKRKSLYGYPVYPALDFDDE